MYMYRKTPLFSSENHEFLIQHERGENNRKHEKGYSKQTIFFLWMALPKKFLVPPPRLPPAHTHPSFLIPGNGNSLPIPRNSLQWSVQLISQSKEIEQSRHNLFSLIIAAGKLVDFLMTHINLRSWENPT